MPFADRGTHRLSYQTLGREDAPTLLLVMGMSFSSRAWGPLPERLAREFRVVVQLDTADQALRPGLTCDAEILADEKTGVLTVPLQSVVLRAGDATAAGATASPSVAEQSGVFVVNGDVVSFTKVTTGIIGGLQIEVSGVAEGARVVSGPFQALRQLQDGARVRVQSEPARP